MPRDFSRTRRIEEQLRRELSGLIRESVKEPELGMISIAEIRVTSDLGLAKVYISLIEDDPTVIQSSLDILRRYAGKLRGLIGKRMHIRTVPQLEFIHDDLVQKSSQLDRLIDEAVGKDREKAARYGTEEEPGGG